MQRERCATHGRRAALLMSAIGLGVGALAGEGVAAAAGATATVSTTSPITVVPTSSNGVAIGDITITPSTNSAIGSTFVCVTLPSGDNFDAVNGLPSVSQTNGAATTGNSTTPVVSASSVALSATAGDPNSSKVQGNVLSFQVSGTSTAAIPTFVLAGLHADGVGATPGTVTASVGTAASAADCVTASLVTTLGSGVVFEVGSGSTGAIYGQSPNATAAAEFEAAFVKGSGSSATCTNNGNAIIATDADPYDALAAAYLEAQLGTGVLITAPTTTSPSTLEALKLAGVQRVYIVGGPLAVSASDIATLKSTPAYACGGATTTGAKLTVYNAIYGQSADQTAAAIDNYITGNGAGALPSITSAYSAESTYNQTSGNETTTAPSGTQTTAIVVADTDYQDATAAAGLAYHYKLPVILTPGNALSTQATSELTKLGITQVLALGGQLALSPEVVTSIEALNVNGKPISVLRIAGQDYTQSAADIAHFAGSVLGWKNATLLVAQGAYWSDSLGAAALSGRNEEALLLTEGPTKGVGAYTTAALKLAGTAPGGLGGGVTSSIQVLGGPLAVPQTQISTMDSALASGS